MHQLLRNVSSSIIAFSLNVILALSFLDVEDIYLPFVPVGNVSGTGSIELPEENDDTSDAINTPPFPFGDSIQSTVFVRSQNKIFETKINSFSCFRWAQMVYCPSIHHSILSSIHRYLKPQHPTSLLHSGMM